MERMREIALLLRSHPGGIVPQPLVLDLYDGGWAVIPGNADKSPMVEWTEFQTERPTREWLEAWIDSKPPIWQGVTGAVSNRITLDFDGVVGLATMEALGLRPDRSTPRRGCHVDFLHPGWRVKTVSGGSYPALAEAYPGMDVRGDGGLIGLLGGNSDGSYVWTGDHNPYTVADLPEDLLALIRATELGLEPDLVLSPGRALVSVAPVESEWLSKALDRVHGSNAPRNDTGLWLSCQLRDAGFSYGDAKEEVALYQSLVPKTDAQGRHAPYTKREAIASLDQAFSRTPRLPARPQVSRPEIVTRNRPLRDREADALQALQDDNDPPVRFLYEGRLARIVTPADGQPFVKVLNQSALIADLSEVADWVRTPGHVDENGAWKPGVSVNPEAEVVRSILSRDYVSEFPILRGVLAAPVLREDGTVVCTYGYDKVSKFFVALPDDLDVRAVSVSPSDEEVAEAVRLVEDDLFGEFEFADRASKANAVAFLLTAVLRSAIPGSVPLVLIDAPSPGTGKTLLANLVSLIATGHQAGLTTAPDGNDQELRKKITSLLYEGHALVVFDNLDSTLKSPVLSLALTAKMWTDRRLGVSETIRVAQRAVWVVTGNNIRIGGDLPRRCFKIRLDSETAFPWQRQFSRSDIEHWVVIHRGELLWACLTLGRAWFARGCPSPSIGPWGSFEEWKTMIGGILAVGGVQGFLDNLEEVQEHGDPDLDRVASLIQFFYERSQGEAKPARALVGLLEPFERSHDLPSELADIQSPGLTAGVRSTRLSNFLAAHQDQRLNEDGLRCIEAPRDRHFDTKRWQFTVDAPKCAESDSEEVA